MLTFTKYSKGKNILWLFRGDSLVSSYLGIFTRGVMDTRCRPFVEVAFGQAVPTGKEPAMWMSMYISKTSLLCRAYVEHCTYLNQLLIGFGLKSRDYPALTRA